MKPKSLPNLPSTSTTAALAKVPCPQLSQLPKSPRAHGVTYRGLTPGNLTKILAPRAHDPRPFVDPAHPAVRALSAAGKGKGSAKGSAVVSWRSGSDAFRVVAGPKALLFTPDTKVEPGYSGGTMFERWEDRVERLALEGIGWEGMPGRVENGSSPRTGKERAMGEDGSESLSPAMKRWLARRKSALTKSVPMSIQFANNKAKMGGKVFYAFTVKKRVRAAISLVVNQGAKVVEVPLEEAPLASREEGEGVVIRKEVVFDLEEVERMKQDSWVMKDWTYIVIPTMKLYRMPFTELIPEVREALQFIWSKATGIEESWLQPPTPPEAPKLRDERTGGLGKPSSNHPKKRTPKVCS